MTILAVTILRVVAFLILGIGLLLCVLLLAGASTLIPASANLPQGAPGSPAILVTIIPMLFLLIGSFFWWALLICIASIADDLHDMRSRQR